jgi:hypothetical protein
VVVIILFIIAIVFFTTNNKNAREYIDYKNENLSFSFKYPKSWDLKEHFNNASKQVVLSDAENGFEMSINSTTDTLSYEERDCTPESPCGVAFPRIYNNFDQSAFESLGNIDGNNLLVSKTGGVETDYENDTKYIGADLKAGTANYIFQQKDGQLSEFLSVFGHGNNEDRLIITYRFANKESISKWDEYKQIIKEIVQSLEEN